MPYDNEYNRMVADDIMKLNKKYIDHDKATGQGMSGGFLGALAGMILPQIVGAVANKVFGKGMSGGKECGCPDDVAECVCGDDDKEDDFKGGSGFRAGTFMDTGFESTKGVRPVGGGMSAGVKKYKKVKSKMGCGSSGAGSSGAGSSGAGASGGKKRGRKMKGSGIISDLGIPLISNVAGLFGLGSAGAGSSGAGVSGGGSSGGGLSGGERKYLLGLKQRLDEGKKATKRDENKLIKMKDEGKLEGGFLPALLGAVAGPLLGKLFGKGGSGGGMSGGAELGLPVSIAGEGSSGGKKRGRKSKMGKGVSGGALVPVANMKASYMAGQGRSGGKKSAGEDGRKKRQAIVKKIMAEKGLSMIEASKYVKAHNLY
jgi:hypothetical protein